MSFPVDKVGKLKSVTFQVGEETVTVPWPELDKAVAGTQLCLVTPSGIHLSICRLSTIEKLKEEQDR